MDTLLSLMSSLQAPSLGPVATIGGGGGSSTLIQSVLLAVAGGVGGFSLNWMLAERREWHELRRSISAARAEAYQNLWPLCRGNVRESDRSIRLRRLTSWYERGGGLFLSLRASQRYFDAIALLRQRAPLNAGQNAKLNEHLTWLRTEMKRHVGSYTRHEAKTRIIVSRGAQK